MEAENAVGAIAKLIDVGGSLALFYCAYFINKASERLARIEKALAKYMEEHP